MGISATLLFFVSALIVPLLGMFFCVFTPLPTILFFYRWGSPLGFWVPGAAAAAGSLLLTLLSTPQSIPYFLELLCFGLFLGTAMRLGWTLEKVLGGSALLVFVMGILVLFVAQAGDDGGLVQSLEKELKEAISITFQHYGQMTDEMRMLEESLQRMVPLMIRLLPGGALSSVLVAGWLNLLVVRRYCRLRNVPLPPWEEWSLWKAPEPLVWVLIAGGFVLLVPFKSFVSFLGMNALIVLGTIYLFQGLAIVGFYFNRWKLPRFLRAMCYGFLLLQQLATFGAILMGLFDVWFDFRRLQQKPASNP